MSDNRNMFSPCPKNKKKRVVGFWKWKHEEEYLEKHQLYLWRVENDYFSFTVHARCEYCDCTWSQMGLNKMDLYTFFTDLPVVDFRFSSFYRDFKDLLKPEYKMLEDKQNDKRNGNESSN